MKIFQELKNKQHEKVLGIKHLLKYIGPGLLVTVGFIDPGNWASNVAAGSGYGYSLLWMVTLSTIMLIILQHNVAHLGIVTGDCLAEAATKHLKPWISKFMLYTAVMASVSTALAEILGGAIALKMLFRIPIQIGALMILGLVLYMLFSNSYFKLEKWIIGFVSLIGLSFLYELLLVPVNWKEAAKGAFVISFPEGSIPIIMSVLGAVVMPHNLFLHSEVIQSRQWNLTDENTIKKQLSFEFLDTLFSMIIGWAINGAMIILAASTFFANKISVTELEQAQSMLKPIAGNSAAIIFAIALLFSGLSSTVTAGMAGGTIFAGIYKESYHIKDIHSRIGVLITLVGATFIIFLVSDPYQSLIYSQMLLSIQLPITVFLQIYLTSSEKVMGKYKNSVFNKILLYTIGIILLVLNALLLHSFFQ